VPELAERLAVLPIRLPPLRERQGDVRLLAEHFLRKYARRNPRAATSLSPEATRKLEGYAWPGNVRELENVIERAAILARGDVIQPEHLQFALGGDPRVVPAAPAPAATATAAEGGALDARLDDIERRELLAALARCNGNKAEVARSLGVQRTTLYYRLKRLGIDV
jgi:DNA-binding NtrC family response regulator